MVQNAKISSRDLNKIKKLRELGQNGNYIAFYVANQMARLDVGASQVTSWTKEIAQVLLPSLFKGKKGGSNE